MSIKEDAQEKTFLYLRTVIKKNIPNLLTLCNLFCGCIAIVFAFEGNLIWCAYMAGIACVFDFLDGLVARLLNVNSEIGKQLDSLADMVSFGVVPGVILFKLINQISSMCGADIFSSVPVCYAGFLVTIISAVRLAKFNIDARQRESFTGLPTPANTIFILSLPLILEFNTAYTSIIENPYFLISLPLISSFLLIAPLSLFALKFKNFSWTENKVRYIFLALAATLLIIFKFIGIPLIIILYIVLSVINNLGSQNKKE